MKHVTKKKDFWTINKGINKVASLLEIAPWVVMVNSHFILSILSTTKVWLNIEMGKIGLICFNSYWLLANEHLTNTNVRSYSLLPIL